MLALHSKYLYETVFRVHCDSRSSQAAAINWNCTKFQTRTSESQHHASTLPVRIRIRPSASEPLDGKRKALGRAFPVSK